MSKAFTSEETSDEVIAGRAPSRTKAAERRPITAEGHHRLVAEHAKALAEKGTEPEAKHRLALLTALLESVEVHPTRLDADGGAGFGCTVRLREEGKGEQRVRLVGPDEAQAKLGEVSVASPLGRALLGSRAGDEVELERPSGLALLEVLEVGVG